MAPRVRKGAVKHARAQQRAPVPRALAAGLEHQVQTYLSWLPSLMSWIFDADGVEPMRCKGKHASGHLSVGSACSGWSSDLMALDMLNISYVSCLAAELDKKVRELGSIMHQHHHVFEDCCSQAFLNSPTCSLFMAGFPCQAWSVAGRGEGFLDSQGRGLVIFWLLKWVWHHWPAMLLLENVGSWATQHRAELWLVLEILQLFGNYTVQWKVLDCARYGFLPQHRERIFIAAVRKDAQRSELVWPTEVSGFLNSSSPCPLVLEQTSPFPVGLQSKLPIPNSV